MFLLCKRTVLKLLVPDDRTGLISHPIHIYFSNLSFIYTYIYIYIYFNNNLSSNFSLRNTVDSGTIQINCIIIIGSDV